MSALRPHHPLRMASFLLLLVGLNPLYAAPVRNKLAVGVPYTGVQVHWGFFQKWALEVRALKGNADTDAGDIKSDVFGLRLYNYFHRPSRLRFFWGLEAATTSSKAANSDYRTTGAAGGAFIGMEMYLMNRLSVGIDGGPYVISSREKTTDASGSQTDFVVNTFVNFYLL